MNKKLIIKTAPGNWDDSRIIAQGIERDGYVLNSAVTTVRTGDIPEPYLSIWHRLVDEFRHEGLADGERLCVMAEAERHTETVVENETEEPAERLYVRVVTTWQWSDGRMTSEEKELGDASSLELVDFLFNESSYVSSVAG